MKDSTLYKSLRDTERVELVVYGSRAPRCLCTQSDVFIEDGRPHSLSAISLANWSLLSSSIKDYRNGVLTYTRKFLLLPLLLFYAIIFIPVFMPNQDLFWVAQLFMIPLVFAFVVLIKQLVANYLKNEFHPAIHRVVDELMPAISASGFEMEYIVEDGWWRPRSILCFTRKEELP
jgi:hypothetical protein